MREKSQETIRVTACGGQIQGGSSRTENHPSRLNPKAGEDHDGPTRSSNHILLLTSSTATPSTDRSTSPRAAHASSTQVQLELPPPAVAPMTTISALLTLPSSSRAFSAVVATSRDESINSPTLLAPRSKVAKLSEGADSASASRSRGATKRTTSSGVMKLEISGLHPRKYEIVALSLMCRALSAFRICALH